MPSFAIRLSPGRDTLAKPARQSGPNPASPPGQAAATFRKLEQSGRYAGMVAEKTPSRCPNHP